jgi:hypothetical protein
MQVGSISVDETVSGWMLEGSGTCASDPAIFECARIVVHRGARPGERECIGERRQRCRCPDCGQEVETLNGSASFQRLRHL